MSERQKIIPQTPLEKKIRATCPNCNLLCYHRIIAFGVFDCLSCKSRWVRDQLSQQEQPE